MKSFNHQRQMDDVSCGPACVEMVATALLASSGRMTNISQFQIRHMMGTNDTVGTTEVQMSRGLAAFGITVSRQAPSAIQGDRMERLVDFVGQGNMALARVMKDGYRHWIVVAGMASPGRVIVLDPDEHGPRACQVDSLRDMMAPRGFESWEIPADSPCMALFLDPVGYGKARDDAVELARASFGGHVPPEFDFRGFLNNKVDWDISMALRDGDRLLGAYLLADRTPRQVLQGEGCPKDKAAPIEATFGGLRGVEGVALMVRDDMRDRGYGRLLRAMPGELGYDYCHGLQLESLGNIDHWRKVREVVSMVSPGLWQSAGRVNPLRPMMIAPVSTAHEAEYEVGSGPSMG